jgi:glycosyltransferase involved in cell wall biosynthesis
MIIWNLSGGDFGTSSGDWVAADCRRAVSLVDGCGEDLLTATLEGVLFTSVDTVTPIWPLCPPGAIRVLEMDELESSRAAEFSGIENSQVSEGERGSFTAKRLLEKRWIPEFDLVSISSEQEVKKIHDLVGVKECSLSIWPNVYDANSVAAVPRVSDDLNLLFVGNLGYPPNQDGVLWFTRSVLPPIRARYPLARFTVVGLHCPESLARLLRDAGADFVGAQRDLTPYYESATIAIVPLRAGTGTRIKILEAFSMNRPVVSTAKGAEGLGLTSGKELLIAESPSEFADACLRLFMSEKLRNQIVQEGERCWRGRFSQDVLDRVVASSLQTLRDKVSA